MKKESLSESKKRKPCRGQCVWGGGGGGRRRWRWKVGVEGILGNGPFDFLYFSLKTTKYHNWRILLPWVGEHLVITEKASASPVFAPPGLFCRSLQPRDSLQKGKCSSGKTQVLLWRSTTRGRRSGRSRGSRSGRGGTCCFGFARRGARRPRSHDDVLQILLKEKKVERSGRKREQNKIK